MVTSALDEIEALGRAGFTVSICYGPSGAARVCRWSVQVLSPTGAEFERPYAADNLDHAVWIAAREINARGWGPNGDR